ncbi:MAG TPA: 16S rRNA (guanine(527)-N(7))-methyltransferase RsmG [Rhizomicrobium sp.]|jgi:16S rRNA (guanine527-N7)-methyltransferase|nr:16S rRNA (guanine(527)-N(7))-methyltransferase RsmG [Rhizomicrobium sp.]
MNETPANMLTVDIPALNFGADDFGLLTGVSAPTLSRLKTYATLLAEWNTRHNLVSKASMADLWRRHFMDSAQLATLIPKTAKTMVDLGSGAGFPGLVLAEMLRDRMSVTLYESTTKKCMFLRTAAECMSLDIKIVNGRLEDQKPRPHDVVTSRALAPLPELLGYGWKFMGPKGICLFLKGQNLDAELTEAHKSWKIGYRKIPSQTSVSGEILEVRELAPNAEYLPDGPSTAPHPGGRQPEGRRR